MFRTIELLLPALIPSWRFFDTIAPSPRIEFVLLRNLQDSPDLWHEFRPRPERLSVPEMIGRMFWNSRWNESLFLASCAERLMRDPTAHNVQEIVKRIKTELERDEVIVSYLQFRLVFVSREGAELHKHIAFISPVFEGIVS